MACFPMKGRYTRKWPYGKMGPQRKDVFMTSDTLNIIDQMVRENPVVLFMKGTADFPMCGFSSRVVQILQSLDANFVAMNVMADPVLRQGIKDYTNWPTIPQLYVKGEFIGGCDIVTDLYKTGELKDILDGVGVGL
jgi:monothiol glutaredoxin